MEGSDISVYFHVPFCRRKCSYCDFYSLPEPEPAKVTRVIDESLEELDFFLDRLAEASVKTLYVGGGTPSLLPRRVLARFLTGIRRRCLDNKEPVEWSIEANPESLDKEFLQICRENGISRLSLGVQSLQPRHLNQLGRPGSLEDNLKAIELIKENWKGKLNFDLLVGLPGQSFQKLEEELSTLAAAAPGHLSCYQLSPPRGSSLEQQVRVEEQEELWLRCYEILEQRGYRNYEISNFARPGEECQHNLRYWNMEPYLGIGPGAVSTLPDERGEVKRLSNAEDIDLFLRGRKALWSLDVETVDSREFLFENLMMGLRLTRGLSRKRFEARFGRSLPEILPILWERWDKSGFLLPDREVYALNRSGRLILDRLLLEAWEQVERLEPENLSIRWPEGARPPAASE